MSGIQIKDARPDEPCNLCPYDGPYRHYRTTEIQVSSLGFRLCRAHLTLLTDMMTGRVKRLFEGGAE